MKNAWNATDGYMVYKVSSGKSGECLKNVILSLAVGVGTNSLYNNPYFPDTYGKADITVEVSEDDTFYTEVYDLLKDKRLYREEMNPYTSAGIYAGLDESEKYEDTEYVRYGDSSAHGFVTCFADIDLSDYAAETLYVKIKMRQCSPAEIKSGASSLTAKEFGDRLYSVRIQGETAPAGSGEGGYYVYDNFRNNPTKMKGLVGKIDNAVTEGSMVHALVPSYEWAADVNAGTASVVYEIPVNGNGIFSVLGSLNAEIGYYLSGNYNSDLILSLGYDGKNYEDIYSVRESDGLKAEERKLLIDLSGYTSGEKSVAGKNAKTEKTLYLKLTMKHDQARVSLGAIGVKLFDVKLKGKFNFVMDGRASLRIAEDGNGIRFTTLIDKKILTELKENGYELTYGTVILPYDYIGAYGDVTEESVFGENAVYSIDGGDKPQITYATSRLIEDYSDKFSAFCLSLTDIREQNITRLFVARGVIRCEKDGRVKYLFASYPEGNAEKGALTVYDTASDLYASTEDGYVKSVLSRAYLSRTVDAVAKYTATDVYFFSDGTICFVTTRTVYETVGKEVFIRLDPQSDGTVEGDGVRIGNFYFRYVNEVGFSNGISFRSVPQGEVRADGRLQLVRYYVQQ
ncbi:MAG: hypothetical protein SOT34_05000 [Candidatus Borkfalkiaceae bacterium]|nr:hypothetical protein [Christensenellaceae bacterium]